MHAFCVPLDPYLGPVAEYGQDFAWHTRASKRAERKRAEKELYRVEYLSLAT